MGCEWGISIKISGFLAVFHGGLGGFVISAGAAFRHARGGNFADDVIHAVGGDSIMPVLIMSAIVRTRTTSFLTGSVGFGAHRHKDRAWCHRCALAAPAAIGRRAGNIPARG